MTKPVLIIGGGLSGLTAAHRLHQAGQEFLLLEARQRLGGRILSADATGQPSPDGFDLGPSWFWPGMGSAIDPVVKELGLASFLQHSAGSTLFQRDPQTPPQRYPGFRQEPTSMRFAGGTAALVSALAVGLPADDILLDAHVTEVRLVAEGVEVHYRIAGCEQVVTAAQVVFALPPRLLQATIRFTPALDAATARNWRDTPTWMAPHAKFFALYNRPFWREVGLSGDANSQVGPLVEIHDATTASGKAALFGFVGVPAAGRAKVGQDAVVAAALRQLAHLFGPEAGIPHATLYKDWAADPLTATSADASAGGHPYPGGLAAVPGDWDGRIILAGSEAARREPGYLAGAVEAAEHAVLEVMNRLERAGSLPSHAASV
ncbi:flavin monoamine oxidase family protein [Albidovulum sp.]|uniref:flavin monoamine oxidase family protein n=1 Tax=Albidovulum sp. TaxID=1872424 RepID=UPI0039B96C39